MTKKDITKAIVCNVVGFSTSFTIANLIRRNLDTDSKLQNAEIWVGSVVVGAMIADRAREFVSTEIDEIDEMITSIKSMRTA